ncbi:MAG: putative Rieske 2Fe-2S iron-sulfur protein [Candidatus Anoxychlamydiales bacterium]|nr:putative Rieske 2Fe-2S iron-sulfur protein [Candidatus Anoxychlamydiales bacterium]
MAGLETTYNNLEKFFDHNFWELKIEGEKLEKGSFTDRLYNWVVACFSSNHFEHIQRVVSTSCKNVKEFKPKTNEEKILLKKAKILRIKYLGYDKKKTWDYETRKNSDSTLLQPYKDGKFFYNNEKYKKSYWRVFWLNIKNLFPGTFKNPYLEDLDSFVEKQKPFYKSKDFKIQWIGHASFLIQVENQNILIDPVWSNFVSPCFKRYTKPGIDLDNLPKIDTILITHNHVDHLDPKTLQYFLKYQPTVLVPLKLTSMIKDLGFKNVQELNWFDEVVSTKKEKEVKFTCTPAYHWSQPTNKLKGNETLWCGWIISANDQNLYHAGDTAFSKKVFDNIKRKFHEICYALLPAAPEHEEDTHMGVESFFRAVDYLKPEDTIAMHHGAYRTGPERVEDPKNDLQQRLTEKPNPHVHVMKIGQIFDSHRETLRAVG